MRTKSIICSAMQLFLLGGVLRAGDKPWIEVRSPHFRVLTPCGLGDARQVAAGMEQMRYVFEKRTPWARLESGAPLTVIATCDEATVKKLLPYVRETTAGEFFHGWQKQFALIRMDAWRQGGRELVYHEYTHSILHMNAHWLPMWFDEGMAEFFGYTRFEGHRIYLGAPTMRYMTMRSKTPISVEQFISLDTSSPYYREVDKVQQFYAQAWAMVHYLTYGQGMENGKKLDQFYSLLQQGVDQKKAFIQAFGEFKQVDKGLEAYMLQPTFTTTIVKDVPQIDEKEFVTRTMSSAETDAEIGAFLLWCRNGQSASDYIDKALGEDPKLGLAHEDKGFLLFGRGEDAAAAKEFNQAFALDRKLYLSLYFQTMLSPLPAAETTAEQEALKDALLDVYVLNKQFAPPLVQLAILTIRQHDLNDAYDLARKAEELEPSLAGYHLLTGRVLLQMGKGSDAAGYARYVADRWIAGDHNEAVELWNKVPQEQRPPGEPLKLQAPPPGSQTVAGALKFVTCADHNQLSNLVILREGQPLTFRFKSAFASSFADTIWYGGDHFTLCHHLEGKRAIVYYSAASEAAYAGDIVELEIRDELSGSSPASNAQNLPAAKH